MPDHYLDWCHRGCRSRSSSTKFRGFGYTESSTTNFAHQRRLVGAGRHGGIVGAC